MRLYPNVRIITTSRETQAAYYASDFQNVRLVGVEYNDIISYLKQCAINTTKIGLIMSNKALVKCLQIPLYLCMFCAEEKEDMLPETPGEILYYFFHRNSSFYNIRSRAADTRTNTLNSRQTAFVLDFILPYMGWYFEDKDCFSVSEFLANKIVCDSIKFIEVLCTDVYTVPFADFDYKANILLETARSFYIDEVIDTTVIINCIHGYLGIVYQYQTCEGVLEERNRFAFGHHQFRDYFSAIWDVQLLYLLPSITVNQFWHVYKIGNKEYSFQKFLNKSYWQDHKTEFISQILMEHRNRPQLDKNSQDWYLPSPVTDEQQVLNHALDFCRELSIDSEDIHYLLENILSAILDGRKELSGVNLTKLNFAHCRFFNVTCSRSGKNNALTADFSGSQLYMENFVPANHQDYVIEFVYHNNYCYTLDDYGIIKCWDVKSGKLEFNLEAAEPSGLYDFSSTGYMKISPDGTILATKIQKSTAEGIVVGIQLYKLSNATNIEWQRSILVKAGEHKVLNSFSFTCDSKAVLFICDNHIVYCFSLETMEFLWHRKYDALMKHTTLDARDVYSSIYAFTSEYNSFEWETEDYEILEETEDSPEVPVPCQLLELSHTCDDAEVLYSFIGMPQTVPIAKYIPNSNCFLLFNYDSKHIESFNCKNGKVKLLFDELTKENDMPPDYIHIHEKQFDECYIMYPDNCYLVNINTKSGNGILMKYPASGVNKLLPDSDENGSLKFKTAVAPSHNHFIVNSDSTVYEWNTEEDTLSERYNIAFYSCIDLIYDAQHRQFILVHQYNGISVFAGNPVKLKNSFCFHERNYHISNCCYNDKEQLIALTFARDDHEKVIILNMITGEQITCFSTLNKNETIETLSWSDEGKNLLITTQYQSCEYILSQNQTLVVVEAGENERIIGGNYIENEIEIAIVQDKIEGIHVITRCEYYKKLYYKEKVIYKKEWYYVLPKLTTALFPYFIFKHGDLGIQGTLNMEGMQQFWITSGFFLKPTEKDKFVLPNLECYNANAKRIQSSLSVKPFQMIYFCHTEALEFRHRERDNGFSYTYLDSEKKQAVFMHNSQKIFVHNNYSYCTYDDIRQGFRKELGYYNGHAYWDFAIPWREKSFVGCFENYCLIILDADTGEERGHIDYMPGIAICDCDFEKINASEEVIDILEKNGGIID